MELLNYQITVVICCYNSAGRIKNTLENLCKQKLKSDINFEVLLVDNNSTDSTAETAVNVWKSFNSNINLEIVSEPEAGLSHARKKGVELAKGEIIVFCDDDNWLNDDYLQIAFDFMKENHNVGVLGGKGIAVSSIEFPDWFTTYQGGYAVGVQNIESAEISNRGYVWGSGMIVRKKEILSLYNSGFNGFLTGRKGSDLRAGDDSEICKWYLLVGKTLYYNENLIFKHYIEPFRLTIEYNKKLNLGFSQSHIALSQYDFVINLFKRKNKLSFRKIVSLFVVFLFERNLLKIRAFLEFFNKTPFTFHEQTKKMLISRKCFIQNESKE